MKKMYVTPSQTCISIMAVLPIAASYDASVGISNGEADYDLDALSRVLQGED